jgi:predicted Zn-dependent protease
MWDFGPETGFDRTLAGEKQKVVRRKRFTLMPAIALAALSLIVALPTLSGMRLYAAGAERYASVTVRPGDTLWSIASAHDAGGDIQQTIDEIDAVNHLRGQALQPGQKLRIPE